MTFLQTSLVRGVLALLLSLVLVGTAKPVRASEPPVNSPVPMLAYYYIWFDVRSWDRAKTDYSILGRYSSDDASIMHQHIQWAKSAGIQGFVVSWKSTDVLNRRLEVLADVAEQENFKLAVIYQGLDFERNPQPAQRVAADLDFFIQHFAGRRAFQLFPKPLVVWSGTWEFSTQDISQVTLGRRNSLLILASEHSADDYLRLADFVDGNAYYWSSINPETFPSYQGKLAGMGDAVHQHGGIWIPPAAPGFDARLIGGSSQVDRKNGDTFRTQINTAMASSPDAIGIISWNEFSENTHIEPSKEFGSRYLDVLSEINALPPPDIPDFDSSQPSGMFPEVLPYSRGIAIGGIVVLILAAFIVVGRRSSNSRN